MTKITEDQRAELLASNASRDVVEAVLARLDAAERMLVVAMAPRAEADEYGEGYVEPCPLCGSVDRAGGYEHTADCEWVAWGTGLYEWRPQHGPTQQHPTHNHNSESLGMARAAMDMLNRQISEHLERAAAAPMPFILPTRKP